MLQYTTKLSDRKKNELLSCIVFSFPSSFSFKSLDDYIRFLILVSNYKLTRTENPDIKFILNKLNNKASKLIGNITYNESEDFKDYCLRLSNLMNTKINKAEIQLMKGKLIKLSDLDFENPSIFCMSDTAYQTGEETSDYGYDYSAETALKDELTQLRISVNRIPFSYLTEYNCHVEICVALNYLIQAFLYVCNCSSWLLNETIYPFDVPNIQNKLDMFDNCIKNIKNVC